MQFQTYSLLVAAQIWVVERERKNAEELIGERKR
jgi:hypothetical protein